MKHVFLFVVLAVTIGLGAICCIHREVFTDATADLTNDPSGVRARLKSANADLLASQQLVASLEAKCTELSKEAEDFKKAEALKDSAKPAPVVSVPSPTLPAAYHSPSPLPSAPNWTWTVLGRDYHDVVVTGADADTVSITYTGGIGTINMVNLDPTIQKMMNYDPQLAAMSARQKAAAREQIDAEEAPKIAALENQQQAQASAEAGQAASDARSAAAKEAARSSAQIKRAVADSVASDLAFVSKHVYINPQTGQVSGEAYYVQKYEADLQAIQQAGK